MIFDFDMNECKRLDLGSSKRHPFSLFQDLTIDLNDGFVIRIAQLRQYHTYDCILTGFPRDIAWHVDYAVRAAKDTFPNFSERPFVLPPVISYGQTRREKLDGDSEVVKWEVLPQITTIAVLQLTTSFEFVLAIWFQDRIGLSDAGIVEQIKSIDWGRYACERNP